MFDGFAQSALDILEQVLPDSDWGKIAALAIVVFFVLVALDRFKLEWIGKGILHIARWIRCKTRDKHLYHQSGVGFMDWDTGNIRGTYVCNICGDVWVNS